MDEQDLINKLTEVAEWTYPYISKETASIERVKPYKSDEFKTLEANPQLGPRIIKFKETTGLKPCEWCGKIVNQKCSYRKTFNPKPKWAYNCDTCRKTYNPKSGELKGINTKSKENRKPVYWWNEGIGKSNDKLG